MSKPKTAAAPPSESDKTTRPDNAPATLEQDPKLCFARRRWRWLKEYDLVLTRVLLDGKDGKGRPEVINHLEEKGAHAAREYQRMISLGERPQDAEKRVMDWIIAPGEQDPDPLPLSLIQDTRKWIAQFEKSVDGLLFSTVE